MRARDLDRFSGTTYDVLVVGGGIHGLAIAYETASRGLRTALVEAADFGSGSSFNHQKTAHGGLRSLQSASFGRARQSIAERRALARIAPWLLRPLPFITGTYRSITRSRLALRAAFTIDQWLGRKRNVGLEPELHLPAPRLVSKAATLRLFQGIRAENLTGGAQWYDYQMVESDRLTFAFAEAADRAGADLANYAQATAVLRTGDRIAGMRATDRLSNRELEITAGVTINAAGAGTGAIMNALGVTRPFPLLRAMNLVTSRPARDMALAAAGASGRMLTLVPWRGRAIVGTGQSAGFVRAEDSGPPEEEIRALLADANHAFPALKLTRNEITLVHWGLVPAVTGRNGRPELLPASEILDHAPDGARGALTVVGAKYTTARAVAERAADAAGRLLGRRLRPSRTAFTVLPGAGIADHEALAIETAREFDMEPPLPVVRHLIARYAERAADIIRLVHERPALGETVAPGVDTLGAEVVHVVRNEMAVHLSDIVVRRIGLGSAGRPADDALAGCARVAAAELGWDDRCMHDEMDAVRRFYAPAAAPAS
jgi:glycerol-3-phosphate dehydrogenase